MRLFFDENLSPKVARSLRALGEQAGGAGGEKGDWVTRGTTDAEIVPGAWYRNRNGTVDRGCAQIRRAKAGGWAIVTRNHDMLALAISEGVRFVWVDPKGRSLDLFDFTLLVFTQVEAWATLLADNADSGVIPRRTFCVAIHNRAAFKIAEDRISERTRKRNTASRPEPTDRLDLLMPRPPNLAQC